MSEELFAAERFAAQSHAAAERNEPLQNGASRRSVDPSHRDRATKLDWYTERLGRMTQSTGVWCQAWIEATDDSAAAVTAELVAACVGGARARPLRTFSVDNSSHVEPAWTLLTIEEAALLCSRPSQDTAGFRVRRHVSFDRHPERPALEGASVGILLGHSSGAAALRYPQDLLTRHALVTGQPGSGKSTFINHVVGSLGCVPYLVIEPTKQDYARAFGDRAMIVAPGSPGAVADGLRINPFAFPHLRVPVSTHIDRLVELFSAVFPEMWSPLPEVLTVAIGRAYMGRGWSLTQSMNLRLDRNPMHPCFPTMSEVVDHARRLVAERKYSGEVRSNVTAAIEARFASLTEGAKVALFDSDVPSPLWDALFDAPTVLNLDLLGSAHEKALVSALVLLRLWELRRGEHSHALRHLLVIEEAHHLLADDSASGGNVGTAAVNRFAASLATEGLTEFRAAGQGVVIVDQSPSALTRRVLANTSLKVAFRAIEGGDKERLARSLNLADDQRDHLTELTTHEAVVMWEGMDTPHRATMAHQYVEHAGRPLGVKAAPDLAQMAFDDHLIRMSVLAMAASRAEEVPSAEREVGRTVAAWLSSFAAIDDPSTADAVLQMMPAIVAAHLGMSRHWPLDQRVAPPNGSFRSRMLDGSLPHSGCKKVCPHGGCLVRELVGAAAAIPDGAVYVTDLLERQQQRSLSSVAAACVVWRQR